MRGLVIGKREPMDRDTMQREIAEIMGMAQPEKVAEKEPKFSHSLGRIIGIGFALGLIAFCMSFAITIGIKLGVGSALAILM